MYEIRIHKQVLKYLKKLPPKQKENIKTILKELENGPTKGIDVKQMMGEWKGYYRIRTGHIRIIYYIDEEKRIIYVDHIGARGDVYKSG